MLGFSQANQQFYRYAAADNVSTKLKSKAISLVLAGGLIAAIVGPEVSRYSFDFFSDFTYLATYLFAALIQIFNFGVLIFSNSLLSAMIVSSLLKISTRIFPLNLPLI